MLQLTPDQQALVARYVELKRALVGYATSAPLEKQLGSIRRRMDVEGGGALDPQDLMVDSVEELLFEHTSADETSVIDRFLRRHRLSGADRELVAGFAGTEFAIFEMLDPGGAVFRLRSVFDRREYVAVATVPRSVEHLDAGGFLRCRLLPVGDVWVLSGRHEYRPASVRAALSPFVRAFHDDDRG